MIADFARSLEVALKRAQAEALQSLVTAGTMEQVARLQGQYAGLDRARDLLLEQIKKHQEEEDE